MGCDLYLQSDLSPCPSLRKRFVQFCLLGFTVFMFVFPNDICLLVTIVWFLDSLWQNLQTQGIQGLVSLPHRQPPAGVAKGCPPPTVQACSLSVNRQSFHKALSLLSLRSCSGTYSDSPGVSGVKVSCSRAFETQIGSLEPKQPFALLLGLLGRRPTLPVPLEFQVGSLGDFVHLYENLTAQFSAPLKNSKRPVSPFALFL